MLSVRKQKGFKMVLNTVTYKEPESYTLIHLNDIEQELFLRELNIKPFTGRKTISWSSNDPIDNLFKKFASEHALDNPKFKGDITKKVEVDVKGKWCLIRHPDKHIINLKSRENENYNNLNRVCIDASKASQFCRDCNKTKHPGKFYLSLAKDKWLYEYWANYMNAKFDRDREGVWEI